MWFEDRVKRNGGRLKKTTIVALARKLLVALWKYVNAGVIIEGAAMKRPPDAPLPELSSAIFQDPISPGGSRWDEPTIGMASTART
ncbi:hypothetical protein [Mesorhizobium australicum]|uniref:hypothetical protein n=1 Tax=Mesorhizobium australicum TaxID=536018 RepID=UPI00333A5261